MSVVAMKITRAEQHPNADRLRLYEAEAPNHEPVVFVANLENVYEVGDVVAVAHVGTTLLLPEGVLTIRPTKIRGVQSFGMGLGKTDREVGRNLDSLYCWPEGTLVRTCATDSPTVKWSDVSETNRRFDVLGETFKWPGELELAEDIYPIKYKSDGTVGFFELSELELVGVAQ